MEWKNRIRECRNCNHLWHGSAPMDDNLECPNCHTLNGYTPEVELQDKVIYLVDRIEELKKMIGNPPEGSHPDEYYPRAKSFHEERLNWIAENKQLREALAKFN